MLVVLQPARKSHKGHGEGGGGPPLHYGNRKLAGQFVCLVNCKVLWSGTTLNSTSVETIFMKTDRGILKTVKSKDGMGALLQKLK